LANLGATIPTPPDRTNWFTIQDANEFARVAIEEKKQENKSATPDLAEVSIEVDVSLKSHFRGKSIDGISVHVDRPGLDAECGRIGGTGQDSAVRSCLRNLLN
jgi:hypothetical protein